MTMRKAVLGALLGLLAGPVGLHAQDRLPVVGFLNSQSAEGFGHLAEAFIDGLADGGYVEGRDFSVEYRWAGGAFDRLPGLAEELVAAGVDAIFAGGGPQPAYAVQAATAAIPTVFIAGIDPVAAGFVESLGRPGGNMTGIGFFAAALEPKKLELLHQLLPDEPTVAVLADHDNNPTIVADLDQAADALGLTIRLYDAGTEAEIDAAFAMAADGIKAMVVRSVPFYLTRIEQIVSLAAEYGIPAVYPSRGYALAGGLVSYGAVDITEAYREAGRYTARILDGEKPAEMPVVQSASFDFVINLRTANELGLALPQDWLAASTEAVE
jgi:putative ABC transport system substrate-binding protein